MTACMAANDPTSRLAQTRLRMTVRAMLGLTEVYIHPMVGVITPGVSIHRPTSGGPMSVHTVRCVPNQPKTPARSVRVADELWRAAKAKAAAEGETVTDVIVRALEEYVEDE